MYIEFGQQQQQQPFHRPHAHRTWTGGASSSSSGTDDEFSSANSSGYPSEQYSPDRAATATGGSPDFFPFDSPVSAMTANGDLSALLLDHPALLQPHDFGGSSNMSFDMTASIFTNTSPDTAAVNSSPQLNVILSPAAYESPVLAEQPPRIPSAISTPMGLGPAREHHIMYYFQRVRGFQASHSGL